MMKLGLMFAKNAEKNILENNLKFLIKTRIYSIIFTNKKILKDI